MGRNSVSDSRSSSSFARQPVQQPSCEVLQHHMLAARKILQGGMKFQIEHDENVDEICASSSHPLHGPRKGRRNVCRSAAVSTSFAGYKQNNFLSFW